MDNSASHGLSEPKRRHVIGIWSEVPAGARWANEGISRVLGFLVEGAAASGEVKFIVSVTTGMAHVVQDDFRRLAAEEHVDWDVVETPDDFRPDPSLEQTMLIEQFGIHQKAVAQALHANGAIDVDGWVITFPQFTGGVLLEKPRTTLVPDAIPFDFPMGWKGSIYWGDEGAWTNWRKLASEVLTLSPSIISNSHHAARRTVHGLLGCPAEKIHVIPHAAPDISPLLPFIVDREKTPETRSAAFAILRDYARENDWSYLSTFPFEESCYVVVSTRDRPTKNIIRVAEAINHLNREKFRNIKLITTAHIQEGEWITLPDYIKNEFLHFDVISAPDLPRDVHAALYHGSAMSIHASFYEGGIGTLPFFESVGVGTPSLMAHGPHIQELLDIRPEMQAFCFDPYDYLALADRIEQILDDPEGSYTVQRRCFEALRKYDWTTVVRAYARAVLQDEAGPALPSGRKAAAMSAFMLPGERDA